MGRVTIYYSFVFLTFLYVLYRNRKSSINILIILFFYAGLATFLGKSIENFYKIALVLFSAYLLLKNEGLSGLARNEFIFLYIFILFSISFILSAFLNKDYFNLIFSQYGKYVTPIFLFLVLKRFIQKRPSSIFGLNKFLISLFTIQIVLSVIKILTIGLGEGIVGSIAFMGGGPAAILPVLGFILVWLEKRGDLRRKDWIYIIFLIFIAFASLKRATWFIMPFFILLFTYYVPGKINLKRIIIVIPFVLLVFYLGIRLNPTLNKEDKIGGSFDLQYVLEYSQKYNFGKNTSTSEIKLGTGRGGATVLLFKKLFNNQTFSSTDIWGNGLTEVYTTDYEQFKDEKYGVNSKGSVTGIFQSYIASGYVGVVLTILLILSILGLIRDTRIRISIGLLLFWDYLFYSGMILRTQSLFFLVLFIIIYSNLQLDFRLFRGPNDTRVNDQKRYI